MTTPETSSLPVNTAEAPAAPRADALAAGQGQGIEISDTLQVTACPTCGAMHAVERRAILAAVGDRQAIYCPAGHSYIPTDRPSDALELFADLADTRAQLAAARRRLAAMPAAPLPNKELLRRARLLASRADLQAYGKRNCPFCGRLKGNAGHLEKHLRRSHPLDLAEMDAHEFA